jgi:GntR family transcriptional regulator, transcriptional repressor for pyruvate dehydrogenase complex
MYKNLSETVYEKLKKEIINGVYLAGSRLPAERKLADKYNVSRITIRDSIGKLAQLGLVNKVPQSGTYINEYESEASLDLLIDIMNSRDHVDPDILISLMEFRRLAEIFAAKKAARNITGEDGKYLDSVIDQIKKYPDNPDNLSECDYRLHYTIAKQSENVMIKLMFNSFKPVYRYYTDFFYRLDGAGEKSIDFHCRLVNAIKSGDEDYSAYIMEQALTYAENRVKEVVINM